MEYHTPKAAMDAIMMNPPLGDLPLGADGTEPKQENERHMSKIEATNIICRLAANRNRTADEVTALQMGARYIIKRHFERQRNWARRRERQQADNSKAAEPLSPEAELAETVARQKEGA